MHCPVFTSYTYNGDLLVCEKNGTDTIWYTYDENGSPVGIELNGTQYYYIKNVQGDIIGIVDTSGNKVVEYNYNSWGYLRYTTGSMASTLGVKNHLRYRGYYYDTDMGLYYLMSRYYDPRTGRFINADDTAYIGADSSFASYNLFTYCGNNPVMNSDPSGYLAIRADLLADGIDLIIALIPIISGINKTIKQLRSLSKGSNTVRTIYRIAKPAVKKIEVASAKYLSKLGLKIQLGKYILSFLNTLVKYSGVYNKIFPFGFSIGGIIASILAKIFSTYKKRERKFIYFGEYKTYTYIKFC